MFKDFENEPSPVSPYPLFLRPVLCQKIWGGQKLSALFGKEAAAVENGDPVGESWELSVRPDGMSVIENGPLTGMTLGEALGCTLREDGSDFPLLVKFIDAGDRLSVQVHPNKTELWYIVSAEEGSELTLGLTDESAAEAESDPGLFKKRLFGGKEVEAALKRVRVKAGEFYLLPSGLIHAIGSGILIAEIQQNSNVTFRLYDYGRDRPLSVGEAADAVIAQKVFSAAPSLEQTKGQSKIDSGFFTAEAIVLSPAEKRTFRAEEGFVHLLCTGGGGILRGEKEYPIRAGQSCLLPRGCPDLELGTEHGISLIASAVQK